MLVNFHTHDPASEEGVLKVFNYIVGEERGYSGLVTNKILMSAGIHPWYVKPECMQDDLQILESLLKGGTASFVGECGLDKVRGASMDIQETVFRAQIDLAERFSKALIVHCVRAFNELLQILKDVKPRIPVVVHGFSRGKGLAMQLLDAGCYLSFGAAVLKEGSKAATLLPELPAERLLLETDASEIPVGKIYESVAVIKNISLNTLEELIFANYLRIKEDSIYG